jgi:hypothetical protein
MHEKRPVYRAFLQKKTIKFSVHSLSRYSPHAGRTASFTSSAAMTETARIPNRAKHKIAGNGWNPKNLPTGVTGNSMVAQQGRTVVRSKAAEGRLV